MQISGQRQASCEEAPKGGFATRGQIGQPPAIEAGGIPLKQCEACNNAIAYDAFECPHCGHPNRRRSILGDVVGGILLAAIIIGILMALFRL